MPHQAAAPSEADAPRPWARAILHARIPAALKLLLLALFAALSVAAAARRSMRRPHKDWLLSLTTDTTEDQDWDPYVLRRMFRLRARLGWLMRCDRAEGMSLSGHRAPMLRPTQTARAPPLRPRAQNHPESVAKTPRPAAIRHGQSPAPAQGGLVLTTPAWWARTRRAGFSPPSCRCQPVNHFVVWRYTDPRSF